MLFLINLINPHATSQFFVIIGNNTTDLSLSSTHTEFKRKADKYQSTG
jgi:hypothetical protein